MNISKFQNSAIEINSDFTEYNTYTVISARFS